VEEDCHTLKQPVMKEPKAPPNSRIRANVVMLLDERFGDGISRQFGHVVLGRPNRFVRRTILIDAQPPPLGEKRLTH
jgi:hypothetical protein